MTPEFPRAPCSAASAAVDATSAACVVAIPFDARSDSATGRTASATAAEVNARLVPVSPSATGKTLMSSSSPRAPPSATAPATSHLARAVPPTGSGRKLDTGAPSPDGSVTPDG